MLSELVSVCWFVRAGYIRVWVRRGMLVDAQVSGLEMAKSLLSLLRPTEKSRESQNW